MPMRASQIISSVMFDALVTYRPFQPHLGTYLKAIDMTLDDEGVVLADEHAARAYAVKAVRSLAAETALHGHLVGHHRVKYVDTGQNPLGEVWFDEAVEISP